MLIRDTIYFLGVRVDNLTLQRAITSVKQFIDLPESGEPSRKIFFTNVHSIHLANRDPELLRCILNADLVLPDGSGLNIAGKVLNKPVRENLNGTDFTPVFLRLAENSGYSVYLLGAKPEVSERCAMRLANRFPNLSVKGVQHGYFDRQDEGKIIDEINRLQPDILLVGMGSPFQEKWITRHAPHLNTKVCLAVGGLFDFMSGETERAPLWMRKLGIEWFHRFFQNPKDKWDRIVVEIPLFLIRILAKRLFYSKFYHK